MEDCNVTAEQVRRRIVENVEWPFGGRQSEGIPPMPRASLRTILLSRVRYYGKSCIDRYPALGWGFVVGTRTALWPLRFMRRAWDWLARIEQVTDRVDGYLRRKQQRSRAA
jgi:hypothetical protein